MEDFDLLEKCKEDFRELYGDAIASDFLEYYNNECETKPYAPYVTISEAFKDVYNFDVLTSQQHAYMAGYRFGKQHPNADIKSVSTYSDYRKNKNFVIIFKFGDNDFGAYFEDGGKRWCKDYNAALSNVDFYSEKAKDTQPMFEIGFVEALETLDKVKTYLKNGYISSYCKHNIQDNINFARFEDDFKYLKLNEDSSYFKGTEEEAVNWLFNECPYLNDDKEPKSLNNIWTNGEYLIITVKNGFANCKV